jgi:DNA-binding transcriptional LysR family regulator
MVEEGYDLVIRVNPRTDENLVGRAFLHDGLVVVASPDVPRPETGSPVPAVFGPIDHSTSWKIVGRVGPETIEAEPVLTLSSLIMVRDALRSSVGAGRLPLSLASQDLARGRLVHWWDVDGPRTELWALYPSRRLLNARVSAFLDFVRHSFPTGSPEELAAYISD